MIKRSCSLCNKTFLTYPCLVKKYNRGKFCSKDCSDEVTLIKKGQRISKQTEFKKGIKPFNFSGFSYTVARKGGNQYKLIYDPNHGSCNKRGYIRYHRYLIEKKLGRLLSRKEVVHHIDGNTMNNKIDNLMLMTKREHDALKKKNK